MKPHDSVLAALADAIENPLDANNLCGILDAAVNPNTGRADLTPYELKRIMLLVYSSGLLRGEVNGLSDALWNGGAR